MLSQKKDRKLNLTPFKKGSAKIIKLNRTAEGQDAEEQDTEKKEKDETLPPLNKFNSGYFKGRDNDVL